MKIDLHTHTNFSACADKNNSWQELLKKAERENIQVLSVTDHNTCEFYKASSQKVSQYFSGKIVSGVELDVVEDAVAFELLAYNFDIDKMSDWTTMTYGTLKTRQEKLKNKLIEKIKENDLKIDEANTVLGEKDYAHKCVYEQMVRFEENLEFFKKYNINSFSDLYRASTEDKNFPLYIDAGEIFPNTKEVARAVHDANGTIVLAHPYNYKYNVDVEKLLNIVIKYGIDGIEVFHPSCNPEQSKYLMEFATKNNLVITGGSDYHGTEKHNIIGLDFKKSNMVINQPNL